MPTQLPVVVSAESIEEGAESVVYSNVTVVNALLAQSLEPGEIALNALRSYHVDFYLAEVEQGGFAQFARNGGTRDAVVGWVREGLAAMAAHGHAALFDRALAAFRAMDDAGRDAFLEGEYSGENTTRDLLNGLDDEFYGLSTTENLTEFNATWLCGLPELLSLPRAALEAHVAERVSRVPNVDERRRAAELRETIARSGAELVGTTLTQR